MNTTDDDTKTFRGRTLEEVLPQIKADLGPDAEIVRQREGLMGGVGGFFQRPCIEVDARPGEPEPAAPAAPAASGRRFDAYDDSPAMPEPPSEREREDHMAMFDADPPTAEGLTSPGIQEILRQASPFADHLNASLRGEPVEFEPMRVPELEGGARVEPEAEAVEVEPEPEPYVAPEPEPEPYVAPEPEPRPVLEARPAPAPQPQIAAAPVPAAGGARPQIADAIERTLVEAGIDAARSRELLAETVSHLMPFGSPRRLRRLVRQALARRIPIAPTPSGGSRSLAFAGPGGSGKTLCTARLAAAYAAGSDLPVVCVSLRPADGGTELRALLEPLGVGVIAVESGEQARAHIAGALQHALVVVDTPAVSPGSDAAVAALAAELEAVGVSELHLTVPATYSGPAAAELAERLAPLRPTHVTLTHMDETTRVGGLVDSLIDSGRPLSYVSQGTGVPGGLEPADAMDIAALVLP